MSPRFARDIFLQGAPVLFSFLNVSSSLHHSIVRPTFKMYISLRDIFILVAAGHLTVALGSTIDYSPAPMHLFRRDSADSICQPIDGFNNAGSTPYPCNKERATITVCSFPFSLKGTPPTPEELKQEQQCLCTSNGRGNVLWRYSLGWEHLVWLLSQPVHNNVANFLLDVRTVVVSMVESS
jgi:hypothetical protein